MKIYSHALFRGPALPPHTVSRRCSLFSVFPPLFPAPPPRSLSIIKMLMRCARVCANASLHFAFSLAHRRAPPRLFYLARPRPVVSMSKAALFFANEEGGSREEESKKNGERARTLCRKRRMGRGGERTTLRRRLKERRRTGPCHHHLCTSQHDISEQPVANASRRDNG